MIYQRIIENKNGTVQLTELGNIISKLRLSLLSNKFLLDVIKYEPEYMWYYALLIVCWTDLTEPLLYRAKPRYKEDEDKFRERVCILVDKHKKYKVGVDCLSEYLAICDDQLIIKNGNYVSVEVNKGTASESGMNFRALLTLKKLINFTAITLHEHGFDIKRTKLIDSDEIRARFSHYLYNSRMERLYRISFIDHSNLRMDNKSNFKIDQVIDRSGYIFALNEFSTGKLSILSKVIEFRKPILSEKVRICLHVETGINVDLWENCIFPLLNDIEICRVISALKT